MCNNFSENHGVYEIIRAGYRSQYNTAHAHCMLDT